MLGHNRCWREINVVDEIVVERNRCLNEVDDQDEIDVWQNRYSNKIDVEEVDVSRSDAEYRNIRQLQVDGYRAYNRHQTIGRRINTKAKASH
ncbi:hypothetical protein Taro_049609 [Colocasia esculenta]|uniref:Uncharacterized protein n=1 Tax=Colocasia esculenta TaxID=4460 RepID=A0A843XBH9_COLES|nr:hypothetical protein [Colocasia esculenta]